jgi:glycosyltransferase involved in cell wall biosynthesis
LQNQDDERQLVARCEAAPEKVVIIRGSGVDINLFQPTAEPVGVPAVVLAARMLWMKGIREFVEAAKLLRANGLDARFILAGDTDSCSPSAISRQQLLDWQNSGAVEWWGHRRDMPQVFTEVNLVCLPSHGGEGVPKVLIEAAASGRAIRT